MKIALAQFDCRVGDVDANCDAMASRVAQAAKAGCDLVVFPELSDTGGDIDAVCQNARPWDEGAAQKICATAADAGIHVACGLSERDGDRIYNGLAIIDPNGTIVAGYRKVHLFTADPVYEHRRLTAGNHVTLVRIGEFTFGLMLCYDVRFPEWARAIALAGADAIILPAAWPLARLRHWVTLTASRAIENQMYIAAVNRVGTDGPLTFGGASRLLDPWGVAVAAAPELEEDLIIGEMRRERIDRVRKAMRVFDDRRAEIYAQAPQGEPRVPAPTA